MSRQDRHVPQWSGSAASVGRSSVVRIAPRNSHEPNCARNEIGVLALPAEPRGFRQRLLHQRSGIDEDLHVAARFRDQPARQRFELRLDDLVVVVALRIDRDRASFARLQNGERIATGAVVHAQHDDGAHLRHERAGVAAAFRGRRHPVHVAMRAVGQKAREPLFRQRDRVRPGDAGDIEALCAGLLGKRGFQRRRV